MSEKRSDWAAFQSANRAKVRFEETPCAKELKSLELDKSKELTPEQVAEIRRTAKRRVLQAVTGNLVVLAAEDEGESEFVRYELPLICRLPVSAGLTTGQKKSLPLGIIGNPDFQIQLDSCQNSV